MEWRRLGGAEPILSGLNSRIAMHLSPPESFYLLGGGDTGCMSGSGNHIGLSLSDNRIMCLRPPTETCSSAITDLKRLLRRRVLQERDVRFRAIGGVPFPQFSDTASQTAHSPRVSWGGLWGELPLQEQAGKDYLMVTHTSVEIT